jgi:hypothetical protein
MVGKLHSKKEGEENKVLIKAKIKDKNILSFPFFLHSKPQP